MGKTAENERIKLKASYLNTLSAGLWLSGVVVPILLFMPHAGDFGRAVTSWDEFKNVDFFWVIGTVLAMFAAFSMATSFRETADRIIQQLKD